MRRPSFLLVCTVAASLLAGSCSLFDDDQGSSPTSTTVAATTATTSEVLDTGRAPRQRHRLEFTEGATTSVTVSLDLDVSQEGAGSEQVLDSPVVRENLLFTVDRVRGDEADISFTFTAVTIDAAGTDLTPREELEIAVDLQTMVGLGGTGRVNDRGTFTSFSYRLPDDLDRGVAATLDQLEGQLATIALPLPTEPLGVGARWRTRSRATLAGISVNQVTTYEITEMTDEGISYTATSQQSATDQPIPRGALPAGTTARLVSADMAGTITGRLDLNSLASSSVSTLSGTQVVDLTRDGVGPERLNQRLDLGLIVAAGS